MRVYSSQSRLAVFGEGNPRLSFDEKTSQSARAGPHVVVGKLNKEAREEALLISITLNASSLAACHRVGRRWRKIKTTRWSPQSPAYLGVSYDRYVTPLIALIIPSRLLVLLPPVASPPYLPFRLPISSSARPVVVTTAKRSARRSPKSILDVSCVTLGSSERIICLLA